MVSWIRRWNRNTFAIVKPLPKPVPHLSKRVKFEPCAIRVPNAEPRTHTEAYSLHLSRGVPLIELLVSICISNNRRNFITIKKQLKDKEIMVPQCGRILNDQSAPGDQTPAKTIISYVDSEFRSPLPEASPCAFLTARDLRLLLLSP